MNGRGACARVACVALLATVAAGCTTPPAARYAAAQPAPSAAAAAATAPSAVAATPVPSAAALTAAAAPAPLRVTITGLVVRGPDGALEICAGESVRPCPGVRVLGDISPELLATRERALVVRLSGMFDGDALTLERAQVLGARERVPKPRVHCPVPRARGGAQTVGRARAAELERRYPERFAGVWWDRERSLYTVWVTGAVSDIEQPALREGVCVIGGARFSMRELTARSEAVRALLGELPVRLVEAGADVLANRVHVRVENIDQSQLARLRAAGGEALELVSFIELSEQALADLPPPRPRGDVPLVTSPLRSSTALMHALGHFEVRLDETRRCVYLEAENGERYLPLWPFGYAAFTAPLRIVDFDDIEVAREGAAIPFGGGHVPLSPELRERACGAGSAWSGAPSRR